MCASRVNPTCVDRSGRWRSRISGAPLHFVTRCTASGTRGALAHRRGNLDQLADLPFRQWRLQISRGYRLLHDRVETDDPVRRQHLLLEEFIAQALSESFRYARELGVTFERVRAGIHPVNGLAIGLHEACKNILAFLQRVHIGNQHADGVASDGANVACSRHNTDLPLLDGLHPKWGLCPANVDAAPPIAVGRALSPNCLMKSNTSYRLDGLLVQ